MAQPTDIRKLGVNLRRRASSAQAAVTQTSAATATTAATSTTPFGYAEAQANAIITNLNKAVVDIAALTALVNEQRTALINLGVIKGSA